MPYLHDVLPELGDDKFDPAADIRELIDPSGMQAGGGDSFSADQGEATLVYVFEYKKRRSFTRFMLGFNYADEEAPYRLRRELPQEHPYFPALWAQTVHFTGAGLLPDDDSEPADTPNFPAVYTANDLKKTTRHDMVYATVKFTRRVYPVLPDYVVGDRDSHKRELFRFLYAEPTIAVDLLQAEGGVSQLKFVEGGGPGQPAVDTVIGNAFATQVAKTTYNLMWFCVPETYLSSDASELFSPENLMKRVTMVNRKPFLGRKAGNMLMLAPQLQRFVEPVSTVSGNDVFASYNVRIPVVHFDPPKGIEDTDANYPTTAADDRPRGHRLMPWRTDGKWYGAKREDTRHYYLHERDLYDAFRHIKDPDGPALNGDPDPYGP